MMAIGFQKLDYSTSKVESNRVFLILGSLLLHKIYENYNQEVIKNG